MSKFRKGKKRKEPGISTAALPDIVFMLLFFFMVTSKPRKDEVKVKIIEPELSELAELDKDLPILYYWIGKPKGDDGSSPYRLQVDDQLVSTADLDVYLKNARGSIENWYELVNYMKIDKSAPMGYIKKIQDVLRDREALTVQYSSKEK